MTPRLWLALATLSLTAFFATPAEPPRQHVPVTAQEPAGEALVERLRKGGLVLFFRHADTRGMPCDRSFRIGDRDGQRNISPEGREQSKRIGAALREQRIPIVLPVLAGAVYRARDTAELAFGTSHVQVTDGLLADDYAGPRFDWVLGEHRRLFSDPVATGTNRVLVGHRTPAILGTGRDSRGEGVSGGGSAGDRACTEPARARNSHARADPGRGFSRLLN